jgi:phospholipase C
MEQLTDSRPKGNSMRAFQWGLPFAFVMCFGIAGCSGTASTVPPGQVPKAQATPCAAANYSCIEHIVIIIQENRSFNNLFMGYPGAATTRFGMAGSRRIPLRPRPFEDAKGDISHCWQDAMSAWNRGKMDGFDQEKTESFPVANCPSLAHHERPVGTHGLWSPYVFVPHDAPNYVDEAGPYWQMAMQYVLADHYFPTDFGPSFTAHQYLVAGTTDYAPNLAITNYPGVLNHRGGVSLASATSWSCDSLAVLRTSLLTVRRKVLPGTGPFPCFTTYGTIADSLDARGVSWQYFTYSTPVRHARTAKRATIFGRRSLRSRRSVGIPNAGQT